jgi:hypothetical protein
MQTKSSPTIFERVVIPASMGSVHSVVGVSDKSDDMTARRGSPQLFRAGTSGSCCGMWCSARYSVLLGRPADLLSSRNENGR